MTDKFDPYYKWLGIPAADQPPTHYRLLGIEPLESDPDVICNAADARMALVKTFQAGRHSGDSQRLLNELATAKVCLLNAEKKAAYDRELGEIMEYAPGLRSGGEVERTSPEIVPIILPSKPSGYLARNNRKKSPVFLVFSLAGICAALLVLLFVLFGLDNKVAVKPDNQADEPVAVVQPPPAEQDTESSASEPSPEVEEPVEEPKQIAEPAPPPETPPVEPEPSTPVERFPQPPKAKPARPPKSAKRPVPDAAAQRKAEQEIRKLFADDFAAADTDKKKLALAAKLRKQSGKVIRDPVANFVCYRMAAETVSRTGIFVRGFAMLDMLAKRYDVDPLVLKIDVVETITSEYRTGSLGDATPKDLRINVNTIMELVGDAERSDNYAQAVRAARLAVSLAKMTKNDDLLRKTTALQREVGYRKVRFRAVEEALRALAEKPDDAAANQTAGEWRCFALGDWRRGLPLLAKGADAELSGLARRDLAGAESAEEQKALGDDWFAAGTKELSISKRGILDRACYWYARALPKLTGLEKIKLEKRLTEIHSKGLRGVVAKGNVALAKNGTKVSGVEHGAKNLFDGDAGVYEGSRGQAFGKLPTGWIVELDRVYQLREIRFRLYDIDGRSYRYKLSVSPDGDKYTVVKDAGRGEWSGWQKIEFSARPVKTILIEGLHNSKTPNFVVTELEAYCVPPKGQ